MSARPIGEIASGIVQKIAEKCGFADPYTFTGFAVHAIKKDGPQHCDNSEAGLTCNAIEERRS